MRKRNLYITQKVRPARGFYHCRCRKTLRKKALELHPHNSKIEWSDDVYAYVCVCVYAYMCVYACVRVCVCLGEAINIGKNEESCSEESF